MHSSGFSLFELLIVMIITAVLALIGASSWRDFQARSELSSITRELIQFLIEVKADADSYNYNQNIYVLRKADHDWCLVASNKAKPINCQMKFSFTAKSKLIELAGLTVDSALVFYGRRSAAKAATIRLKNRIGESRIIISVPGRIRYCSYYTYLVGFHPC